MMYDYTHELTTYRYFIVQDYLAKSTTNHTHPIFWSIENVDKFLNTLKINRMQLKSNPRLLINKYKLSIRKKNCKSDDCIEIENIYPHVHGMNCKSSLILTRKGTCMRNGTPYIIYPNHITLDSYVKNKKIDDLQLLRIFKSVIKILLNLQHLNVRPHTIVVVKKKRESGKLLDVAGILDTTSIYWDPIHSDIESGSKLSRTQANIKLAQSIDAYSVGKCLEFAFDNRNKYVTKCIQHLCDKSWSLKKAYNFLYKEKEKKEFI